MLTRIILTLIGIIIIFSFISSTESVIKLRTLKDGKLVVEQFYDSSAPLYQLTSGLSKEHIFYHINKRDYLFYVAYQYRLHFDKDILLNLGPNFELRLFMPGRVSNSNAKKENNLYLWRFQEDISPYLYHATHKWRFWLILPTLIIITLILLWKRRRVH